MPELPEVVIYQEALAGRLTGQVLRSARVPAVSLLRTWSPPLSAVEGRTVLGFERLGKRLVCVLEGDLFLVVHLMIAGRWRWLKPEAKPPGKLSQAVFGFDAGQLVLTEAGTRKRASLHVVAGRDDLATHDPGGIDPLTCAPEAFAAALTAGNHTLKRALCDPRALSGIGNAWSDEILHAAKLSPLALTGRLAAAELARLHAAAIAVLTRAVDRLRAEVGDKFPDPGQITAFRDDHAVHGKYGQPCPVCGDPVQRIVYAENEVNYCPGCQTGGKVLADRSLSRLLKDDWPRTVEAWEATLAPRAPGDA